jgi:hypothetical protein
MKDCLDKAHSLTSPFKKLKDIEWKYISFTKGEFNSPHTHGDTIFLPKGWEQKEDVILYKNEMTSVLIHEKIHIFQRFYPIETHNYIFDVLGFDVFSSYDAFIYSKLETISKDDNVIRKKKGIRLNPDTNSIIYSDSNGSPLIPYFTTEGKNIISDVRDHPYEIMAYSLTDIIILKRKPSQKELEWMQTHL